MITYQTILTFGLYILGMIVVGILGFRATKNLSDYILGGRRLGSFVTALSAGASDMSGWLLMGLPGGVFKSGISEAWIAVGLTVGAWANWKFVAARLRLYTELCGNALTLPDYFGKRFEDNKHILRIVTAIVILVFFTIYCSSGMVAGARLFESMFPITYINALWIGALATIAYVFVGGFLAVSWTDTIQASMMITALILTPLMIIYSNGGVTPSLNAIALVNPSHLDILKNLDWIAIISLMAWGLGYFGQPHILVRFMAAKSTKTIPAARRIGMTWMILCLAGAIAVGFFGLAYFSFHPELANGVNQNSERVFIELAKNLFNPWVTGFLLASILAAIMSTLSCQLLVCASALTEDIYKAFINRKASQRELVICGRIMVLGIALIAIFLAINPDNKILKMVSYAWAGFGAAFGPAILISLYWKRMNFAGTLTGIIVGAMTVVLWKNYANSQVYEIIPGFILSTITIFIVSLLTKTPTEKSQEIFDQVEKEMNS